ncbi:hypothetical protein BGW41_003661 [Actinomortierella wolfii]|nr:hypothetical protein BGW41_003661 [Actinomortierella wolfii]
MPSPFDLPEVAAGRSTIFQLVAQDYVRTLRASTQTGDHGPKNGTVVTLASKLSWVRDLQVTSSTQGPTPFTTSVMNHILQLCSNLRRLEIDFFDGADFSLELYICFIFGSQRTTDVHYAELLAAGGSNRWRKIDLSYLGPNTATVLANHADSLEYLVAKKSDSSVDQLLVDLLASCTRLRVLQLYVYEFNPHTFIDYTNEATDEQEVNQQQPPQQQYRPLRPWKCEKTLVEFKARIGCIPRSDIPLNLLGMPRDKEGFCLSEIYPGQSHELQEQVMARLGRFHNLQHLRLGLEDLDERNRQHIKNRANHQGPPYDDPSYQYECLDMTLENGLGMLLKLRQLRHLNVGRMASRIGPQEIEWMIEHWPRLRVIEGLCPNEESKVKSKFQELAPHIQAIEFLPIE